MPGAGISTDRGLTTGTLLCLKNTMITERFNLQFRAEFFNIFNHTQFLTPSGITGFNIATGAATSQSFGVRSAGAAQPRIGQLSLKLNF